MEIEIKITGFEVKVKPVVREDNIKAFVDWIFNTDQGVIKIHGGTLRVKLFGKNNKELLTYDAPAIRSRSGYAKVLFIDNLEIFKKLCDYTLNEYYKITNELPNNVIFGESEDVDPESIPI